MGLCFSRDKVNWLLRHSGNPPPRQDEVKSREDLAGRYLPELLFHREELRSLIQKYIEVIRRYGMQYLAGYNTKASQTTYSLTNGSLHFDLRTMPQTGFIKVAKVLDCKWTSDCSLTGTARASSYSNSATLRSNTQSRNDMKQTSYRASTPPS